MATKYYITVNKEGKEPSSDYDMVTARKAEYTKLAKDELKKGAESVDIHASNKDQCTGDAGLSYIGTLYPEYFNIK